MDSMGLLGTPLRQIPASRDITSFTKGSLTSKSFSSLCHFQHLRPQDLTRWDTPRKCTRCVSPTHLCPSWHELKHTLRHTSRLSTIRALVVVLVRRCLGIDAAGHPRWVPMGGTHEAPLFGCLLKADSLDFPCLIFKQRRGLRIDDLYHW